MKLLDLDGHVVVLDDADFERLAGRSLYIGTNGYVYFSTNRTGPVTLHSFVMGGSSAHQHIDHIDGNKLNNLRTNLRLVTPQVNQANRKRLNRNNTSGVRGVAATRWSRRNPWRAQITVRGKNYHLGLFPTEADAVSARRAAEVRYFGEECPR